jgi:3-oxoacyl-[acyl-carrier-protein] synthase-3
MVWNSLIKTSNDLSPGPRALSSILRRAIVAGTGSALPAQVFRNDDFPASLNTSDEWIRTRTGIRERRIAGPDESSFTLGLTAAREALAASGLSPDELDLIIFATVTPDTMVPSNACRVQGALGCPPIGAFDVIGACTGFVQGLAIAHQFIATGSCNNVLVIGAEVLSRTLDYNDRGSCILFGDGAGAMVLSSSNDSERGLRWTKLYSDGAKSDLIRMPSHVTQTTSPFHPGMVAPCTLESSSCHVQLNGREVFKFAVRTMVSLVQEALRTVKLPSSDRLFLVPHQVNQRIIDAALEELPIPHDRVVLNLERYGNTSAASIPIALDEALRTGQVGSGDHLLLVAFGGGMTWGGAVLTL